MDTEVRFRLPSALRGAATAAADARGISLTALISVALHEYLHAHGELGAFEPQPARSPVEPAKPKARPVPADLAWQPGYDGERYVTDDNGDDWTEAELKRAYAQGDDPLGYYG